MHPTKGLFTGRQGCPSKRITLTLTHFLFFLRRVYNAARLTGVGGSSYLRRSVILAEKLIF